MKITCQSCQSKYTVSDEKVQGKTVKIKCRKCGATILVNSGGVTTSAPADPVSLSSGGQADAGASYLVNVADGDQRSLSLPEIVAAYQTSVVTAETYVWADGMGDWQPLGQVDAIVAALHAGSAPSASAPAPAMAAAEPEHRAAARRDPARPAQDLFGGRQDEVASSAPGYSNGSAGAAAMRAAPAPMPSAPRGGEENSMLFSLSALTAKTATTSSAAPRATTARDKEDSGIIDLKALAASASAPAQPTAASFLPDGGLFGAPIVAAPVAPPVVAPSMPPPKSKTPLFLGIGGVVAVGAIVGAFLVMRGGPPPPPPAAAATAAPTAEASAAPTAEASATPSATATASAEASAAPTATAVAKTGRGGKPYTGGKAGPSSAGKAGSSSGGKPAAPAGPKRGNCGCSPGDLMCAMKCSAGKK